MHNFSYNKTIVFFEFNHCKGMYEIRLRKKFVEKCFIEEMKPFSLDLGCSIMAGEAFWWENFSK